MSNEELINNKPKRKKIINTSGQGKNAIVPKSVANRFNWGAFGFGWIWGIFNKTWITFIYLVINVIIIISLYSNLNMQISWFIIIVCAFLSLAMLIWFGVKGNTWAWQNKRWKNIEHFHKIQRRWAIALLILYLPSILMFILIIIMTLLGALK